MRYLLVLLAAGMLTLGCNSGRTAKHIRTFTNPLLPRGADPYCFYKDGYYYYTHTTGHNLVLWKTKDITDLANAEKKVVWEPPPNTMYSHSIWAPQIHFINGKWYMYFAADNGNNYNHRMYVIENASADPLEGEWVFKGKVADATNKWAIDADVFEHKGSLYMVWSGWEGDENGQQNLYIARMKNPWTIESERVKISSPEYEWEKHGDVKNENVGQVYVNEGPQYLRHKDKIFIVYSASGCWTDYYTLGMLSIDADADLLNPANWKKHPEPVFKAAPENGVYGAGHNSFFKSPDGKEDWILYHANPEPGLGCGRHRSPRAQKFTWNEDGTPNFGKPLSTKTVLQVPSE
jgi:Predicted beta-xylosidase